jgi:Rps23 Pro-64 3,4-dihydroxylase Tpa1-like proline 4-hydroxylase
MIEFKIINEFLTKEECKNLLDYSLKNLDLKVAKILTDDGPIIDPHRKSKVSFDRYSGFNFLNEKVNDLVSDTYSIDGHTMVHNDKGYQFTSYETGEYYNWHTDSSNGRYCSVVINLNDEYDGGDLELRFEDKIVKLKNGAGNCIIFLSNTEHRVIEVTNGTRYSLVNWLILKENKENKKSII